MAAPISGREPESRELMARAAEAASGRGSLVLVSGEAGIGKTTLAEAACSAASSMGFRVERGAAVREAAEPFNVLSSAFGGLVEGRLFEELGAVSFAEVMAINPAGLLLAKASDGAGGLDTDIFAGMLTAVQSFVRDSFDSSGASGAKLGRLEYGSLKILIESGELVSLTAVLEGQEHPDMALSLRAALKAIEAGHGETLRNWSGNMADTAPLGARLKELASRKFLVRRDLATIDLEAEMNRVAETAISAISRACADAPLLILLEDLHWAAENSLRVLEYLARNIRTERCMILGTSRPFESGPLSRSAEAMVAEGTAVEMRLSRFDREALRVLLDSEMSPSEFPQSLYDDLFARTGGNPLFALELARHLRDAGAIRLKAGVYRYEGGGTAVPGTVEEAISGRLDRLSPDLLAIAEAASCIGREFDLTALGSLELVNVSDEALEGLGSAGVLVRSAGSWAFSHGLFQEVVYNSISPRWRSKYHWGLARYYETRFSDDPDAAVYELARHFSLTSDHPKALKYCTRAGEKAEAGFAVEQALMYYGRAVESCQGDRAAIAMLHGRIGDLLFILSDIEGACAHYSEVLALAEDPVSKADVRRKMADAREKKSEYDLAKEEAARGLEMLAGADSQVEARLLMSIGRVQMRQGDYPAALENLARAAAVAERHGVVADLGMAEHLLGSVHLHKGEFKDALEHFERAATIRREAGDIRGEAASVNNIGNVYARIGEWDKALERYTWASETDTKVGDRLGLASTLTNIASVHLSMGKPDEAIPILERAIRIERKIGDKRGLAISLININLAYYLKVEFEKAIGILTEALEICEANSLKYECIFCYNGLCEMYSTLGRAAEGLELARKSLALSKELGTLEGEAMSLMFIGTAHMESGDMDRAREALEKSHAMMEEMQHNQLHDIRFALGVFWMKAGEPSKALPLLREALAGYERNKDERNMARCRELLEGL
jgi:tetratricopeptide (TPR) repeat protein